MTPAIGIFPYSIILPAGAEFTVYGLLVINTANIIIILMLFFLSYPLYFFGSDIPDRLVKKQLLDFLLRGPATGLIVLAMMNFTAQATRILSLPGEAFAPPAIVGAVLLWQWFVSLALPYFEKFFIYRDEDDAQITKLQMLSDRVLTHDDLSQLIMATTESICDHLRIDRAFVISFERAQPEFISRVGDLDFADSDLLDDSALLRQLARGRDEAGAVNHLKWREYALVPLLSRRASGNGARALAVGALGLPAGAALLDSGAAAPSNSLQPFVRRVETSLDDMRLQAEIYNLLEGLLPQFQMTRSRAAPVEYRQSGAPAVPANNLPERAELFEQVRAALRHYWGGSGISQSNLIQLQIVQERMQSTEDTPVQALRKLLADEIDALKPGGERKLMSPEWTLYNILQLRFLESRRVREVSRRLSMSEADLYRKQRIAILAVTDQILEQELQARAQ